MSTLAVVAWIVYIALAFGYRSYVQFRTTGRSGLAVLRGGSKAIDRLVSSLIVGSLVFGFASACFASSPGGVFALVLASSPFMMLLALVVYLIGLTALLGAQFAMGKSWRIGVDRSERTELVVTGPFRIVRNPIFTAMLVTGLGLSLLVPSWASFVAYALLVVALELQVRVVEEPHLVNTHGGQYLVYAAHTGRFIPGIGRFREPTPSY